MATGSTGQRVIFQLVNKLGVENAAAALGIRSGLLMRFLTGTLEVPDSVLLKAVDYIQLGKPEHPAT